MLIELTPMELFRSLVVKAIKDQGVETTEMVEYYLSSLLSRFVKAGKLKNEAFSIRLLTALQTGGAEKTIILKELGDSSLFLSGFFQESLNTRLVDIDYYMDMGAISYYRLADYFDETHTREDLAGLYTELSEKFTELVDVLTEVSERSRVNTSRDILKLYERWLKTKSAHTEALLRELGINPIDVPTGSVQ